MISMSSSLAGAALYHNIRRNCFNGGRRMSDVCNLTVTLAIPNIAFLA